MKWSSKINRQTLAYMYTIDTNEDRLEITAGARMVRQKKNIMKNGWGIGDNMLSPEDERE